MTETDVNFSTPAVTYDARREYAPIGTINEFLVLRQAFEQDTSMGITNKKATGLSFKGVKNILDPAGEVVATITVQSKLPGIYPDLMTGINSAFAEENLDDGYTAVEDTDKRNWKMTLSGETAAGDPFKLQLDESYAILSGYHLEATLEIFEEWADGRTELSTAPTA